MVKKKTMPKPRLQAGHAARTSQPVNDTTISDDSDEAPKTSKSAAGASTRPTKKTNSGTTPKKSVFKTKDYAAKTKPGMAALKEIHKLQHSTKLLIPKAPFLRLIKEIIYSSGRESYRVTEMAVEALREASECVLTNLFEDAYLLSLHAKRVTLFPTDIALVLSLRRDGLTKN